MSLLKSAKKSLTSASAAAILLTSPAFNHDLIRSVDSELMKPSPDRMVRNIQLGETLRQDTTKLEVILTAVPQTGNVLNSYLVNGVTDAGDWCQWGIAYADGQFTPTFQLWKNGNPEPAGRLAGPVYRTGEIIEIDLGVTNGIVYGHSEKLGVTSPDGALMTPIAPNEDKKEITMQFTNYKASTFKGMGQSSNLPPFNTSVIFEESVTISTKTDPVQIARQTWQIIEPKLTNGVLVRASERDYPESNPTSMITSGSTEAREVFQKAVSFPSTFKQPEGSYAAIGDQNFYVLFFSPDCFMTQSGPFLSTNSTPHVVLR